MISHWFRSLVFLCCFQMHFRILLYVSHVLMILLLFSLQLYDHMWIVSNLWNTLLWSKGECQGRCELQVTHK
jgi:hypothetical protein